MRGFKGVIGSYKRFQVVTRNYRGSTGVTGVMASFKGLQVVTGGYKELPAATMGGC